MKKIKQLLYAQRMELTGYNIYQKLALGCKGKNRRILRKIANEEKEHYESIKKKTGVDVKQYSLKYYKYISLARIFGVKFGLKLMESDEKEAQKLYRSLDSKSILKDEINHEKQLVNLTTEKRVTFIGSVVLGLSDAIVEITGALAGMTLAFADTSIISAAGVIMGIAASLSMAASEYLSIKAEQKSYPMHAAIYTGSAYILTVFFLLLPFFLITNPFMSLGVTVINAIVIIMMFTFYVSVIQNVSFKKRFVEMSVISLGVAGVTFALGYFAQMLL